MFVKPWMKSRFIWTTLSFEQTEGKFCPWQFNFGRNIIHWLPYMLYVVDPIVDELKFKTRANWNLGARTGWQGRPCTPSILI